jgi:dihydroxyacid dehydratase/phosphogluconate dehydratase
MNLQQIKPADHGQQTVAPLSLAELKALYNSLAVDVATGGGTTPGVNLAALLDKVGAIIQQSEPPAA